MKSLKQKDELNSGHKTKAVQILKQQQHNRRNAIKSKGEDNSEKWDEDPVSEQNLKSLRKHIFDSFDVQFTEIKNLNDDSVSLFNLSTNGLFKVEGKKPIHGGQLEWYVQYRLRHLISGQYLAVIDEKLGLTKKRDEKLTLFQFIPIDNLMQKFESKKFIHKDAYYRIQHNDTKFWLGFDQSEKNHRTDNEEYEIKHDQNNAPQMYHFLKDINTYRFRKATFQEIWETYFLIYSLPILLESLSNVLYINQSQRTVKQEAKKLPLFDALYENLLKTIKSLQNFVTNKIISNISMDQEYNYPSLYRQEKFKEQLALGLICWILSKIFPKPQEFQKLELKPSMDIIYQDAIASPQTAAQIAKQEKENAAATALNQGKNVSIALPSSTQEGKAQNQNKDKSFKSLENHVKRRFVVAHQIYQLIKMVCYRNVENQNYFGLFLKRLSEQIGYGDFVAETFQYCFQGNVKILNTLHQVSFPIEQGDKAQEATNTFSMNKDDQNENFFRTIVKRLRKFDPYTKNDILSMLGNFCILGDTTIYINQEKIYSAFTDNRPIIFTCLLKVSTDDNQLYLEAREKDGFQFKFSKKLLEKFENQQEDRSKGSKGQNLNSYLLSQFELYAKMSAARNYTCGKAFEEIFPENLLQNYIKQNEISMETKSVLTRLLLNIYIDREPRIAIQKPNLVRIFTPPGQNKERQTILAAIFNPAILRMFRNPNKYTGKQKDMVLKIAKEQFEHYFQQEGEDIYIKFIKNNAQDSIQELRRAKNLIDDILKMCNELIMTRNPSLNEKGVEFNENAQNAPKINFSILGNNISINNGSIKNLIYNNFTYEIVKMFHTLTQFGLFTSYIQEQPQDEKRDQQDPSIQLMETILRYLSFLLEFDQEYNQELSQQQPILRRRFQENIIKRQQRESKGNLAMLGDIADLGKGLINLDQQEKQGEENKEDVSVEVNKMDKITEKDTQENLPFMRIYESLHKLLGKYINQTYKAQQYNLTIEKDYEVKIKIEICKVFEYLMDWREDYFIDNAMKYFSTGFYQRYAASMMAGTQKEDTPQEYEELETQFCNLLPENLFSVGEEIKETKRVKHVIDQQVRNFDVILDRPFIEVLINCFYFADDFDLQNSIMNLIQRSYSQQTKLLQNIEMINLVQEGSSDNSYQKMSELIGKLKALNSYSQSWLQIIEQNNYNKQAQENLDVTLQKLQQLKILFKVDQDAKDDKLIIKQKIFKHLDGYEVILKFLEQGSTILDSNESYFHLDKKQCKFSYKQDFIDQVIQAFFNCNKILKYYCRQNSIGQKLLFRIYKNLLPNMNNLNIGQISFINQLFRDNLALSLSKIDDYLLYMTNLIKIHGHYPQFLQLFEIILINAQADSDSLEIPRNVILNLLKDEGKDYLSPFEKEIEISQQDKDLEKREFYIMNPHDREQRYKEHFVKIINMALQYEIGVNFVVKASRIITVQNLLPMLKEQVISKDKNDQETISIRNAICQILLCYFNKLQETVKQFKEHHSFFIEVLEKESKKILSRNVTYSVVEQSYLMRRFIPMVNMYTQSFLKDIVLIAIMSIQSKAEFESSRKVYEFAKTFIANLNRFIDISSTDFDQSLDETTSEKLKNVARMSRNLKLTLSEDLIILRVLMEELEREETNQKGLFDEQQEDIEGADEVDQMADGTQQVKKPSIALTRLKTLKPDNFESTLQKLQMIISLGSQSKMSSSTNDAQNKKHSSKQKSDPLFMKMWSSFKWKLQESKKVQEAIKDEGRSFYQSVLEIQKILNNPQDAQNQDLLLSQEDIIQKLLQFIQYWKEKGANKASVIFTMKTIKHIILRTSDFEENPQKLEPEQIQKQKRAQQNLLDSLNTTYIALRLFWTDNTFDSNYQYYIIKLLIALLDEGNHDIQIFKTNPESQKFFKQLSEIIKEEISNVTKNDGIFTSIGSKKTGEGKKPLIQSSLQLMQLFCEGHYTDMQDYLRKQSSSQVNYDMIELMVNLLVAHKISNQTYRGVEQCFDTLTEVVQGPCQENQLKIVTSSFLQYAVQILKEEPKQFQFIQEEVIVEEPNSNLSSARDNKHQISSPGRQNANSSNKQKYQDQSPLQKGIKDSFIDDSPMKSVARLETPVQEQSKMNINVQRKQIKRMNVHRGFIARIKHKCVITLLSLLEMSEKENSIMNRVRRTVPIMVLMNNITDTHILFDKVYKGEYFSKVFRLGENQIEQKQPLQDEDEIIIEFGFNSYILMCILLESQKKVGNLDTDQSEIYENIKDFTSVDENKGGGLLQGSIFGDLAQMGAALAKGSFDAIKNAAQKAQEMAMSEEEKKEQEQLSNMEMMRQRKEQRKASIQFFAKNTISIEVVRDDEISKISFPFLPICKTLPKENKEDFHENVDSSTIKGKLRTLLESSDLLIKVMEHEEDLRLIFKKNFLLGFIAERKKLWEDLAFYVMCALNLIITFSYSQYLMPQDVPPEEYNEVLNRTRMGDPRLFFEQSYTWTPDLIQYLGITDLVLVSLVVFFFFVQKAPLLLKDMWIKWKNSEVNMFQKYTVDLLITFLMSVQVCLLDFQFVYYSSYMVFVIVAIIIHPFYFGFLTMDFLRIKLLKNVVKAVWIPRVELVLTFLVFVLIQYYFTILGYIFLHEHYNADSVTDDGEDTTIYLCESLWRCFLITLDWTFKQNGALGGFLSDPVLTDGQGNHIKMAPRYITDGQGQIRITEQLNDRYLSRFIFDNMFQFILALIVINMVSGIIIDTFGALKQEAALKEERLTQYCFMCGIDREKLDKAYENQSGFYQHIKRDHYIWNYVFFKAWISFQNKTEFTGNETYIGDLYQTFDVSWLPIKRAIAVLDDENAEERLKNNQFNIVQQKLQNINDSISTLELKARNLFGENGSG